MESNAVLLLGNHEVHYLKAPLFRFPGYQTEHAQTIQSFLEDNISRFRAAYVADGWLCTHAGLIDKIAGNDDVVAIYERISKAWDRYLPDRSSEFIYQSVFFYNFWTEGGLMARNIAQIFGHVEVQRPVVEGSFVALDTTNFSNSCWLYDTDLCELVQLSLVPKKERLRFVQGGWAV
jgi:hypothetical protein